MNSGSKSISGCSQFQTRGLTLRALALILIKLQKNVIIVYSGVHFPIDLWMRPSQRSRQTSEECLSRAGPRCQIGIPINCPGFARNTFFLPGKLVIFRDQSPWSWSPIFSLTVQNSDYEQSIQQTHPFAPPIPPNIHPYRRRNRTWGQSTHRDARHHQAF